MHLCVIFFVHHGDRFQSACKSIVESHGPCRLIYVSTQATVFVSANVAFLAVPVGNVANLYANLLTKCLSGDKRSAKDCFTCVIIVCYDEHHYRGAPCMATSR
jgi:hypothetical protein